MVKVAILGAAGGIGKSISLILKKHPLVDELALYDIVNAPGVATDLSHINTKAKVTGYNGVKELDSALIGCDVVVVPAGVPRKPGMTRDDLFKINAGIVKGLATAIAKNCPKAFTCVISNPVNSTVPICAEVFKTYGCYDPKKLFGVTTLDVVRANTFVSECKGLDVSKTDITVIGGHSGTTIIPLLSQIPGVNFTESQIKSLTQHIQFGGDEVVKAKNGKGSATLSMAYAGAVFVDKLLNALVLNKTVTACSYVESPIAKADGVRFFSSALKIGRNGIEEYVPLGKLSEFEQNLYNECIPQLKVNIEKGVNFVAQSKL